MTEMKLRIFHIDDSPTDREITREVLKSIKGFDIELTAAQTGMEGLEKLEENSNYDLIILDYNMAGMNGTEFMKELEKRKIDIPIIVSSGGSDSRVVVEAMKLGAYDYVIKDEIFKGGMALVIERTLDRYRERKEKERLEAETIKYANELKEANEKLKKFNQMKSDFVSIVSHELRTPLTIIKEGISITLDGILGRVSKEQQDMLTTAKDNIDRLVRIVNDLLDISKIEAGKLEFKREFVDMASLVKQVISTFELKVKEKGLDLKTTFLKENIGVYADKDKIIQAFTNLIGNALKFTKKGYVEISVKELEDMVECSVIDTGRGMPKEALSKVFNKFQQFGAVPGGKEKGTGLGLSITKGIIEMHKGDIFVESKFGEGTKFTFTLPKYTPDAFLAECVKGGLQESADKGSEMALIIASVSNFDQLKQNMSYERIYSILKGIRGAFDEVVREGLDVVVEGNSEVAVVLVDTGKDEALKIQERLKQLAENYLVLGNPSGDLKLEFGCAIYPGEAKNYEELLGKAKVFCL